MALHFDDQQKSVKMNNQLNRLVQLTNCQVSMAELEWYKLSCERKGKHYYTAFKNMRTKEDKQANQQRLIVVAFWRETVELVANDQLPEGFALDNRVLNPCTVHSCSWWSH